MTVELRTTMVDTPFGWRGERELWHFTDDVELDLDDDEDGPLWALVGMTEDRDLTVEEALYIAEFYGGSWDEEAEQVGMVAALQTLADLVKVRGWQVAE